MFYGLSLCFSEKSMFPIKSLAFGSSLSWFPLFLRLLLLKIVILSAYLYSTSSRIALNLTIQNPNRVDWPLTRVPYKNQITLQESDYHIRIGINPTRARLPYKNQITVQESDYPIRIRLSYKNKITLQESDYPLRIRLPDKNQIIKKEPDYLERTKLPCKNQVTL